MIDNVVKGNDKIEFMELDGKFTSLKEVKSELNNVYDKLKEVRSKLETFD